jgi:tyrosine-protein phosphatase YwqE
MFNFFRKQKEPGKLWFSTDIHCHIVPGVDDGSPSADVSADLIERMQSWGINRIIASPHVTNVTFENTPETIAPAMQQLHDELQRRGNSINVANAAEYRIDELFLKQLESGNLMTYPNDYILIENAFIQEPWELDQLVFDLQVKGLRPILAHPERYYYYYPHRERYRALHDAGLKFQINVLSLAGHYGKQEKSIAEHLIDNGLVDFVGTDLHNMSHVESIDKYLMSKDLERHTRALAGKILNDTAFK